MIHSSANPHLPQTAPSRCLIEDQSLLVAYLPFFPSLPLSLFFKGLEHLQQLVVLNVYFNRLAGLKELHYLQQLEQLRELDLRLNPMAMQGASAISFLFFFFFFHFFNLSTEPSCAATPCPSFVASANRSSLQTRGDSCSSANKSTRYSRSDIERTRCGPVLFQSPPCFTINLHVLSFSFLVSFSGRQQFLRRWTGNTATLTCGRRGKLFVAHSCHRGHSLSIR